MEPRDVNNLRLQFRLCIHEKHGIEFQTFCEHLLQKVFTDFKKVKHQHDRGNDGYIETSGTYYQMYAPEVPQVKGADAARKAKADFDTLKASWDTVVLIKQYVVVFNDKYRGTSFSLEQTLAELRRDNPTIKFEVLSADGLERLFLRLKPQDVSDLGFDIDTTKAVAIAKKCLENVETYIDRGNGNYADAALAGLSDIISELCDEDLTLEYQLLSCRTLERLERTDEAIDRYRTLCDTHQHDLRPILGLARLCATRGDFARQEELLQLAETIDASHCMVRLQRLIQQIQQQNPLQLALIEEGTFPEPPRLRTHFYRVCSASLADQGDFNRAEIYINHAIRLNPDLVENYWLKRDIAISRCSAEVFTDQSSRVARMRQLRNDITPLEQKITSWGDTGPRIRAILNSQTIRVLQEGDDLVELASLAKPTAISLMQCSCDQLVAMMLAQLLHCTEWPPDDLATLRQYLKDSQAQAPTSLPLAKALVFQFLLKGSLLTAGKEFFSALTQVDMLALIDAMARADYDTTWELLKDDLTFATTVALTAKEMPALRWKIVEHLTNITQAQKDKLLLLLYYEEGRNDDAFRLLKGLDISALSYTEAGIVLAVAETQKAWDFAVIILEKLLQYEKDGRRALEWQLRLLQSLFNLERFLDAARLGEALLTNSGDMALASDNNREWLLSQTVLSCIKRGEARRAKSLMEQHYNAKYTVDFKFGIEAEVYLVNDNPQQALAAVVAGVCQVKHPTPEQYADLLYLVVRICSLMGQQLTSEGIVAPSCFVKLTGHERWYFVGDDQELDATKLAAGSTLYHQLLGKRAGESIDIREGYSSREATYSIEHVFSIEQYVCWQSWHQAHQMTLQHRWNKMTMVEVPMTDDSIDTKYLIAMMEDEQRKIEDPFDAYCHGKMPLAFLAASCGGLTAAIGSIVNEQRGFISCCPSDLNSTNRQGAIARRVLAGESFYIDGTSALVLSETGLLAKIMEYIPGMKVPQSVITYLLETMVQFTPTPGAVGHMQYARKRLRIAPIDKERATRARSALQESVAVLESRPSSIVAISYASKADCVSERRIPAALCDACILAQKDSAHVLTEDFRYLQANAMDTGKQAPEYCSTIVLMRVLYESGKISFDQYLEYFAYLSSYRFRFLAVSTEDLLKAVFGDAALVRVEPKRLRLLNLPLTMSEEYGVSCSVARQVVASLLINVIVDDSVPPNVALDVFAEILSSMPTKETKKSNGRKLLSICAQAIGSKGLMTCSNSVKEKFSLFSQFNEGFSSGAILLT